MEGGRRRTELLGVRGLRSGLVLLGHLGVAGLEAGDAAAGVEDLLLAGVERVALRAHVGVDDAVLRGAPRRERGPTGAGHLGHVVLRVDVLLHGCPFRGAGSSPPPWAGREPVPNRQSLPLVVTPEPIAVFPPRQPRCRPAPRPPPWRHRRGLRRTAGLRPDTEAEAAGTATP